MRTINISRCPDRRYLQETALLVDSNRRERQELGNFLVGADYHVLATSSCAEGLELCRHFEGAIHLLVMGANLPGDHGQILAELATKLRPGIVVLFLTPETSAHPGDLLKLAGTLARQTQGTVPVN
ncbi:MAG TPA: response regulator [Bryobacteraceae bacterium]|jgi:DNA-binding response OmpR family regulator